jgi:serine/threonine protein kinase
MESAQQIHLVFEYVGGTSLHNYIKQKPARKLDEPTTKRIFRQVVEGIGDCHSQHISHRDIKLDNILLDEGLNVKLIDFGFSTWTPSGKKTSLFCGTPSYMAPEIVNKKEYLGW